MPIHQEMAFVSMKLRYTLPLIIFITISLILGLGIFINSRKSNSLDSSNLSFLRNIFAGSSANKLTEKSKRTFKLKSLMDPNRELTQDMFKGKVTVLNVWASWCGPCRMGQEALLKLAKQSEVNTLFWVGLNINDQIDEAQRMLQIYGNPYQEIIYDPEGRLAIHLGIRGTPSLIILDKKGGIQYRHSGPINALIWEEEILPLIKSLQED